MNFMRQIALGHQLTKLTNLVEEIEGRKALHSADSDPAHWWSKHEKERIATEFHKRGVALARTPRHLVTEALLKNLLLSLQLGRQDRARCQSMLLDMLVDGDLAMPLPEFQLSYG